MAELLEKLTNRGGIGIHEGWKGVGVGKMSGERSPAFPWAKGGVKTMRNPSPERLNPNVRKAGIKGLTVSSGCYLLRGDSADLDFTLRIR